jgi:hypothetical protein
MNTLTDESSPLLDVHSVVDTRGRLLDDVETESNYRLLATWWVALATLVRFVCVAPLPLGNGEGYYYSWSRFLDWSYYDHPPLVAWMVRVTTALGTSPAAVRLGPILASGAFGLLFYRLAERLYRPRTAFFALVVITALPVFLFSSFLLNPEAPLAPLWVGFLVVLESMRKRDGWHLPLLAGALLGFAFLAKYTAVLLVPAAILYVAASRPTRRWLRRPSFYAGGLVALVVAMPVLVWNQVRGWPSVRLHLVERASAALPLAGENRINQLVADSSSTAPGHLESIARVLVGQLMSYSPLLAPLLVIALVGALRRARRDDRDLFVTAFSWPVLLPLLFVMMRLRDAEQHWTMMAVMPSAIAVGRILDERWTTARRFRWVAMAGVGLTAFAFVLSVVHARSTALLRLLPASRYDARADIVNELVGWDEVRASVMRAASTVPGHVVLASNHYSMCGRLFFETGDWPSVYCPSARRSAYDFFGRRDVPSDATAILLTTDIHAEIPAGLEGRTCSVVDQVEIERAGRTMARYVVQACAPQRSHEEERASRD